MPTGSGARPGGRPRSRVRHWSARVEAELHASLWVMGARATTRMAVPVVWIICPVFAVVILRAGLDRPGATLNLAMAVLVPAVITPLRFLPSRLTSYWYALLITMMPFAPFAQALVAPTPAEALPFLSLMVVYPVVAFGLWGSRSNVMVVVSTLQGILATLVVALQHRISADAAIKVGLGLVVVGGFLGWAARHRDRTGTDPVTGLGNRQRFDRDLDRRMSGRTGAGEPWCLTLLDVDRLGELDASIGRRRADRRLAAAAANLADVADGSTVYHWGAGTFAVLGADRGAGNVDLARRLLAACPDGLSAGAGQAVAGPDDTALTLVTRAGLSLTQAKAAGPGSVDPALTDRITSDAIRAGLAAGQFTVLYQPIVELAGGTVVGAEALVRWDHPDHGRIAPDEFIPTAEVSGLIHDLGRFVLTRACRQGAAAALAGRPPERLSVNASAVELRREDYAATVLNILHTTGMSPQSLTVEITESAVADGDPVVHANLVRLRARGVRVAIDDFGTGYSSLSRLAALPIDTLKIDKSFVWADPAQGRDHLLAAVIALASAFDLTTVAEGIETWDHVELLRELGTGYGQGYLFGRPAAFAEIHETAAPALPEGAGIHPGA